MSDQPVLKLSKVSKVFGTPPHETHALKQVDFELFPREVVAVMGPSGSGKTTLLTICGALQQPTSGIVVIDGIQIQGLAQRNMSAVRRRKVGFIFQSFNLLDSLTAQENVQYVLELNGYRGAHARERARGILSMDGVDLTHRLDELPRRLSGGEQQRVAIARALANDAPLILADEPTANLDQKRAVEILNLLRSISRDLGRAVMLVTHDMRAHDAADRVFWLEDGDLAPIRHNDPHLEPQFLRGAVGTPTRAEP